jgi:hypothetical protein
MSVIIGGEGVRSGVVEAMGGSMGLVIGGCGHGDVVVGM